MAASTRRVGVLAVQGGFERHASVLASLGVDVVQVRRPEQLATVDGIVLPGGESTTIAKGLSDYELEDSLLEAIDRGTAVFATCAGLILLDVGHLGVLDVEAKRNAYGRQLYSFEAPVFVKELGRPALEAVFIRAPRIERVGPDVETLAEHDGDAVLVRRHNLLAATFHPELTDDRRLHELFLATVDSGEPAQMEVTG